MSSPPLHMLYRNEAEHQADLELREEYARLDDIDAAIAEERRMEAECEVQEDLEALLNDLASIHGKDQSEAGQLRKCRALVERMIEQSKSVPAPGPEQPSLGS